MAVGSVPVLERLGIDDPVGVVSVHLGSSVWGVVAVALFSHQLPPWLALHTRAQAPGLFHGGGFPLSPGNRSGARSR